MIAALALVFLQQRPPHGPEPGPRRASAGLAGFQTVSRLDFGSAQNRLTAVFVFPDRARWHFEDYAAAPQSVRVLLYRQGEAVHQLASGTPSQALEAAERDVVLLQMELRRAVMLWPDGFEWEESDEGLRSAPVYADSCCRERQLGTLVAALADGRARRIEVRDADKAVVEALEIREWQQLQGRTWPRTLAMEAEGGGFVETIESIEPRVHYLELSFLPPDRRPLSASAARSSRILAQDLVAVTYRARDLPEGLSWEQALVQARAWIDDSAETLRAAGMAVDPVPTFEGSSAGRPVRCLVRVATAVLAPPEGFETVGERPGLLLPLQKLEELDSRTLEHLHECVPGEARMSTPYVRIHPRPNLPVELVLPLVPAE